MLALQNHNNALEFAIETLAKVDTTNRSYSSIARELNDLGLTTYREGSFYPQTVNNMIGYLGDLKFVDVPLSRVVFMGNSRGVDPAILEEVATVVSEEVLPLVRG